MSKDQKIEGARDDRDHSTLDLDWAAIKNHPSAWSVATPVFCEEAQSRMAAGQKHTIAQKQKAALG